MNLPDAIDRIRPSVVQIRATKGVTDTRLGSGFVVGSISHVVTAMHVVDAIEAGHDLYVSFPGPDIDVPGITMRAAFSGGTGVLVDRDEANDLALIEVPDMSLIQGVSWGPNEAKMTVNPVHLKASPCRDGTPIAVSGYPLNEPAMITTEGVLASHFSPQGPGPERYLGDFTATHGNSGGPVYTVQDAAVIGVCVGGKLAPVAQGQGSYAAGLTVVVRAEQVIALLERNGVSLPEQRPQPSPPRRKKKRR